MDEVFWLVLHNFGTASRSIFSLKSKVLCKSWHGNSLRGCLDFFFYTCAANGVQKNKRFSIGAPDFLMLVFNARPNALSADSS